MTSTPTRTPTLSMSGRSLFHVIPGQNMKDRCFSIARVFLAAMVIWVLSGLAMATTLDVQEFDGATGMRIGGLPPGDTAGANLSGVGDLNQDGFEDFAIANFGAREVFLFVSNGAPVATSVDGQLLLNDSTRRIRVFHPSSSAFGASISGAGDFNGDGYPDLLIGTTADEAFLIFGGPNGIAHNGLEFNAAQLDGFNGVRISGGFGYDAGTGRAVSSAGDVDGDGYADILVGVMNFRDPNTSNLAGGVAVIYGTPGGLGSLGNFRISDLDGDDGIIMAGEPGTEFGGTLTSLGDVNGDGLDDFAVGPGPSSTENQVWIVYGRRVEQRDDQGNLVGVERFRHNDGWFFVGSYTIGVETATVRGGAGRIQQKFGWEIAGVGDVTGDTIPDLLIGAPEWEFPPPVPPENAVTPNWETVIASPGASWDVQAGGGVVQIFEQQNVGAGPAYTETVIRHRTAVDQFVGASARVTFFTGLGGSVIPPDGSDPLDEASFFQYTVEYVDIAGNPLVTVQSALLKGVFSNIEIDMPQTVPIEAAFLDVRFRSVPEQWTFSGTDVEFHNVSFSSIRVEIRDPGPIVTGAAFLIPGSLIRSQVAFNVDEARSLGATMFTSRTRRSQVGRAVSGTGDLDGDGLADFMIGAPQSTFNEKGRAFLLRGRSALNATGSPGGVVHLEDLTMPNGIVFVNSVDGNDRLGEQTSGIGDITGSGRSNALMGAPFTSLVDEVDVENSGPDSFSLESWSSSELGRWSVVTRSGVPNFRSQVFHTFNLFTNTYDIPEPLFQDIPIPQGGAGVRLSAFLEGQQIQNGSPPFVLGTVRSNPRARVQALNSEGAVLGTPVTISRQGNQVPATVSGSGNLPPGTASLRVLLDATGAASGIPPGSSTLEFWARSIELELTSSESYVYFGEQTAPTATYYNQVRASKVVELGTGLFRVEVVDPRPVGGLRDGSIEKPFSGVSMGFGGGGKGSGLNFSSTQTVDVYHTPPVAPRPQWTPPSLYRRVRTDRAGFHRSTIEINYSMDEVEGLDPGNLGIFFLPLTADATPEEATDAWVPVLADHSADKRRFTITRQHAEGAGGQAAVNGYYAIFDVDLTYRLGHEILPPASIAGRGELDPQGPEIFPPQSATAVFWHRPSRKLYAVQPGTVVIRWRKAPGPGQVIGDMIREDVVNLLWPEDDELYTKHVTGAPPVDLRTREDFVYTNLFYTEDRTRATVSPVGSFQAERPGRSLVGLSRSTSFTSNTIDDNQIYFLLIATSRWEDSGLIQDPVPALIGEDLSLLSYHDGSVGAPWVLFPEGRYNAGPGYYRVENRQANIPVIYVNKDDPEDPNDEPIVIYYERMRILDSNPPEGTWDSHTDPTDTEVTRLQVGFPYTAALFILEWPEVGEGKNDAGEIVIASQQGSGALSPTIYGEPRIYSQNVRRLPIGDPEEPEGFVGVPGFNPNEEHAFLEAASAGPVVYALRSDLNHFDFEGGQPLSEPYVLVNYLDKELANRPQMKLFRVEAEEPGVPGRTFDFAGLLAGRLIQPPIPLNLQNPCPPSKIGRVDGTHPVFEPEDVRRYWMDRKGGIWAKAAADDGGPATIQMRYFYPMRSSFYLPEAYQDTLRETDIYAEDQEFTEGTHLPWLDEYARSVEIDGENGRPVTVTYTVEWPDPNSINTLRVGRTLVEPVAGLPAIDGQPSVEILYDQAEALDPTKKAAVLIDPTREVYGEIPLEQGDFSALSITRSGTRIFFDDLLPTLRRPGVRTRFAYDTERGRLVFGGEYVRRILGEAALLPNVMSLREYDQIRRLGQLMGNQERAKWEAAVDDLYEKVSEAVIVTLPVFESPGIAPALEFNEAVFRCNEVLFATVLETTEGGKVLRENGATVILTSYDEEGEVLDTEEIEVFETEEFSKIFQGGIQLTLVETAPGDGQLTVVDSGKIEGEYARTAPLTQALFMAIADVDCEAKAWDSLALTSALATGTGYVTLAFGSLDDPNVVPPGTPIALEVIRIDCDLHRGEIIIATPQCPFDEKVTLLHNGDFAGTIDDYEFQWKWVPAEPGAPDQDSDIAYPSGAEWRSFTTPAHPFADELGLTGETVTRAAANFVSTAQSAGVLTLIDTYWTVRYRRRQDPLCDKGTGTLDDDWSDWTQPALAEGWIKRVVGDIGPFRQRAAGGGIEGAEQRFSAFSDPQRTVNTIISMIRQAGRRFEGSVPLSCANVDELGLIEVYETVLNRGIQLGLEAPGTESLEAGPASAVADALLLAASRIAALYTLLGNEAYADAQDPTIALSTDGAFGPVAASIHPFMNQVGSLLDEELVLLRGRDSTSQPGVQVQPVYNRFVWNFTNGIDGGEVAYALTYGISDDLGNQDGLVDEIDAAFMFPQGHGDAWGHYLTGIKRYYRLLRHPSYVWVPRSEAVNVGGVAVAVDYFDERKFVEIAALKARTGRDITDLTYRQAYTDDPEDQWRGYRDNARVPTVPGSDLPTRRAWGVSDWASRAGMGAYFDWVVGNAILPPGEPELLDSSNDGLPDALKIAMGLDPFSQDTENEEFGTPDAERDFDGDGWSNIAEVYIGSDPMDPNSPGEVTDGEELALITAVNRIQEINRNTVVELREIATAFVEIQSVIDSADQGLNPLGIAKNAVPFDIDPAQLELASGSKSHFEQIFERAMFALRNASTAFNYATAATQELRKQNDALINFERNVEDQEIDFRNRLIEIFGTPYLEDIGPGGNYPTGYAGPDLFNYMVIDWSDLLQDELDPVMVPIYRTSGVGAGDATDITLDQLSSEFLRIFLPDPILAVVETGFTPDELNNDTILRAIPRPTQFDHPVDDFLRAIKPPNWTRRGSIGELQRLLSQMVENRGRLNRALVDYDVYLAKIENLATGIEGRSGISAAKIDVVKGINDERQSLRDTIKAYRSTQFALRQTANIIKTVVDGVLTAIPDNLIFGLASGGDALSGAKAGALIAGFGGAAALNVVADGFEFGELLKEQDFAKFEEGEQLKLEYLDNRLANYNEIGDLGVLLAEEPRMRLEIMMIIEQGKSLVAEYQTKLSEANRVLEDQERFRRRTAASVQQIRYSDMAYRIFRNDALQKYKAQFDLASRYAYLAAAAYDYETNLIDPDPRGAGAVFKRDIVRARAIGTIIDGQPQTGSTFGDPGLADLMARMQLNWELALRGQLGFNNPQRETNRFSLRRELYRIGLSTDGDSPEDVAESDDNWRRTLELHVVPDILSVPEFRRYCIPFVSSDPNAPLRAREPAIVLRFGTNVNFAQNFFVALPPVGGGSNVNAPYQFGARPLGPGDSSYDSSSFATKIRSVGVWFGNYQTIAGAGMSNTPRIYLVPAGADVMRSPTNLEGELRIWKVADQRIPVPFPLSGVDLTDVGYIPTLDNLTDTFASLRRYPSFRAYHDSGQLLETEVRRDNRLVGRSVWNTEWLMIIPAGTLHANRDEGIRRFIYGRLLPGPAPDAVTVEYVDGDGNTVVEYRDGNGVSDVLLFFETYAYGGG